jgi:class 3 adenylate cyclase
MGDGVLIYFGYPQAHEDDAERAVRAGSVRAHVPRDRAVSQLPLGVTDQIVMVTVSV